MSDLLVPGDVVRWGKSSIESHVDRWGVGPFVVTKSPDHHNIIQVTDLDGTKVGGFLPKDS